MSVYIVNIILTFLICSWVDQNQGIGSKRRGLLLVLLIWSTLYALRYRVGTDWGTYYRSYTYTISYVGNIREFIAMQRDVLFALVEYVTYRLTGGNWIVFQYIAAILTYAPVLFVIGKRAEKVTMPCLLYIYAMGYYSAFNGMRQAIACGFILMAYYNLLDNKNRKYVLLMLIAFGFHSAAMLAVPFHILSKRKLRSFVTVVISLTMLILYFSINQVWPTVISILLRLGQTKMAEDYSELATNGSSFLRFLVAASPVVLGLSCLRRKAIEDSKFESETILLMYSAIIMIYSMHYWIFARVSSLLSASLMLYVPKLGIVFYDHNRKIAMLMISLLYFIYMVLMLLSGEGGCYPYQFWG